MYRILLLSALFATSGARAQQVYPYRVTDLGTVPGSSPNAGVNGARIHRDGTFACGTSVWDPFVWQRGAGMTALNLLPGYPNGYVNDVDGSGRSVGYQGLLTTGPAPVTAVFWDAAGNPTSLGRLNGSWSRALCINDAGRVFGTAEVILGSGRVTHVFSWSASGGMVDFTPSAQVSASIHDVNERNQMLLLVDGRQERRDPNGTILPLANFQPYRLNEYGQIAGKEETTGTLSRYTDGIGWDLVGAGAAIQLRDIGGIDDLGQIVGTQYISQHSSPPSYEKRGHLWTEGLGLQRLDDLIDPAQQVRVWYAEDIAEDGTILASGSIGPDNRAMILEPRFVRPHGTACGGDPGRRPRLGASGVPTAGRRMTFLASGGAPQGASLLLLGLGSASVPLGANCTGLVDLTQPFVMVPLRANPVGQSSVTFTLPASTRPGTLHAQVLHLDSSAPNGAFSLTNGLTIDLQ